MTDLPRDLVSKQKKKEEVLNTKYKLLVVSVLQNPPLLKDCRGVLSAAKWKDRRVTGKAHLNSLWLIHGIVGNEPKCQC